MACYVHRPGDDGHRPLAIGVLAIAGGEIADIVTFGPPLFGVFGLPPRL